MAKLKKRRAGSESSRWRLADVRSMPRHLTSISNCSTNPQVSAMLSTYAAKYRSLKAPRKLQWRPSLGTVSLDLTIGDQTLEFNVRGCRGGSCLAWQGVALFRATSR